MTFRRVFSKAYTGYKSTFRTAFSKYLLYTNVLLSMCISSLGDLLEQTYEVQTDQIENYDLQRTVHMTFSGATTGVISHYWYITLDKIIIGRTFDMAIKKLLLDQLISSPILILSFFATVAIFEDHPINNFTEEVRGPEMQPLGVTWRKLANSIRSAESLASLRKVVKLAFSDKYLLYTNVTISVSLSALGDVMEQHYEIYTNDLDKYNSKRTMHMAFSGSAVGLLCHHWYKVLDKFIIGKSVDMVVKKLLLDQLMFSPIMILTFFGSLAIFENNPYDNFTKEVSDKFGRLYCAEWMVWPPAQVINFYFLPTRFRVLYDNTISLGYDVYTSQVKHGKRSAKDATNIS